MPFVLDASIAACWAFPDEQDSRAEAALTIAQSDAVVVPDLWWFEIRNILVVNERRGRITESRTEDFLRDLKGLRIQTDHSPNESVVLRLARSHRLSVYDASYLELALREAIPLATLDTRLATAAVAAGAELVGADPSAPT